MLSLLSMSQTVSGHYTNGEGMGNVGYRKNQSRAAYSPATQNKKLANFCPSPLLVTRPTLTNPRLYTSSRTDLRLGVPQVM